MLHNAMEVYLSEQISFTRGIKFPEKMHYVTVVNSNKIGGVLQLVGSYYCYYPYIMVTVIST